MTSFFQAPPANCSSPGAAEASTSRGRCERRRRDWLRSLADQSEDCLFLNVYAPQRKDKSEVQHLISLYFMHSF